MSLMMSASGFPCIEGDFPSPVHFWEEERRQAESDRRITGFLFHLHIHTRSLSCFELMLLRLNSTAFQGNRTVIELNHESRRPIHDGRHTYIKTCMQTDL